MELKNIVVILICFLFGISFGQKKIASTAKPPIPDGYEITIQTENLKGKKIELCLYYGLNGEKSIADSTTIKENNEKIVFSKKQKVFGAIYLLRFASEANGMDIVVDNSSKIGLKISNANMQLLLVTSDIKNKDFINYQVNLANKTLEENREIRNNLIIKYPSSALALYCKLQNKIATKSLSNSSEITNFQNTFFSDITTSDSRMFLMPNLYQFLYKYISSFPINNANYQSAIKKIMADLKCNSNNYKAYSKWFLSNFLYYDSYNIEDTFQFFFKNYVDVKDCSSFTDGEIASYRNKSETIKTIPLNSKVPNLILQDIDANDFNLYESYPNYDYSYIAFFSPTCSHCNETMPRAKAYFDDLQKNNPNLKLQLISVINDDDVSLWETFIKEKQLQNWKNLKTKGPTRDFQAAFNAYANPNFVLIDKKGTIVLKSYNPKALNEVFTRQNQ